MRRNKIKIPRSKRKITRNALERLQMVLKGSEEGYWDWNILTGVVKRNDRWAQILGYSDISEFDDDTDTWTTSIHPDDRDRAWQSINNHLQGKTESHNLEYRMKTKEGSYIWINDHAKIVERDSRGKPVRMCGTHRDITVKKEAEEERDRIFKDLQRAQNEIQELKGIISVCSNCHKVMDNDEMWRRIESYLERNSGAKFSHGICKDCIKELYGDQSWYKEK